MHIRARQVEESQTLNDSTSQTTLKSVIETPGPHRLFDKTPLNNSSSEKGLVGNRPFARFGHVVRNKLCRDASYFQTKGMSGWTGTSFFVSEFSQRYLRPNTISSLPCDRIMHRAY